MSSVSKICPVCGMEFIAKNIKHTFCSEFCYNKNYYKNHKEYYYLWNKTNDYRTSRTRIREKRAYDKRRYIEQKDIRKEFRKNNVIMVDGKSFRLTMCNKNEKPLINALLTIRKKKILYKGVLQHEFNETK
jgi:hypothetical protein